VPDFRKLYDAVLNGDAKAAAAVTTAALAEGAAPGALVADYMIPAMAEAGRQFEAEECFVPELLLAARAMKAALEPVRPLLAAGGAPSAGTVVIGTVQGDLHDIGKNLVAAMLEGGGFTVHDLGANVAPQEFLRVAIEKHADLVALSALLTVTMPAMKTTVEFLRQSEIGGRLKVMVGGAPVTRAYASEIGADGYGESAPSAVGVAKRLIAKV
jgi:5-methyltetrahydrofolate--homocysteine methyltransferase